MNFIDWNIRIIVEGRVTSISNIWLTSICWQKNLRWHTETASISLYRHSTLYIYYWFKRYFYLNKKNFHFTFLKKTDSSDTCITTSTRKESGERSRGAGNSKGERGMGGVGGSGGVSGGGGGSDGKPTRVRTVLNEKQLHTLRTCYAANPWWRSSWWRWRACRRESSASGSRTSDAKTRKRPSSWNKFNSKRR